MMRLQRHQRGVVLIVSLLMLLVMSMLVVSAVTMSNTNLLIINNVQSTQRVEALAQNAIEEVISSPAVFELTSAQTLTLDNEDVSVSAPECLGAEPATGYSAVWALAPEDTSWELIATVVDDDTGASATVTQGLKSRLTAGSCG